MEWMYTLLTVIGILAMTEPRITSNGKMSDDLYVVTNGNVGLATMEEWAAHVAGSVFGDKLRIVAGKNEKNQTCAIIHSCHQPAPGSRLRNSVGDGLIIVQERAGANPVLCAEAFARGARKTRLPGIEEVGVSAVTPAYASEFWGDVVKNGDGVARHLIQQWENGAARRIADDSLSFGWGVEYRHYVDSSFNRS